MSIGERILLSLSRSAEANDCPQTNADMSIENALDLLTREIPGFSALVSDKRVLDFGCGHGYQSIALVKKYRCSVVGLDSNKKTLAKAIANANDHKISSRALSFVDAISVDMLKSFDVVISKDSFEHFPNPAMAIDEMASLLSDSGVVLLTFGPPWLAPFGSHMHFFCRVPWVNVFFSEDAVMKVRGRFRSDGATTYEDVESGLNRMTIAKFESILSSCNLKLRYRHYGCVKGADWIARMPLLREFFINQVTAILASSSSERWLPTASNTAAVARTSTVTDVATSLIA